MAEFKFVKTVISESDGKVLQTQTLTLDRDIDQTNGADIQRLQTQLSGLNDENKSLKQALFYLSGSVSGTPPSNVSTTLDQLGLQSVVSDTGAIEIRPIIPLQTKTTSSIDKINDIYQPQWIGSQVRSDNNFTRLIDGVPYFELEIEISDDTHRPTDSNLWLLDPFAHCEDPLTSEQWNEINSMGLDARIQFIDQDIEQRVVMEVVYRDDRYLLRAKTSDLTDFSSTAPWKLAFPASVYSKLGLNDQDMITSDDEPLEGQYSHIPVDSDPISVEIINHEQEQSESGSDDTDVISNDVKSDTEDDVEADNFEQDDILPDQALNNSYQSQDSEHPETEVQDDVSVTDPVPELPEVDIDIELVDQASSTDSDIGFDLDSVSETEIELSNTVNIDSNLNDDQPISFDQSSMSDDMVIDLASLVPDVDPDTENNHQDIPLQEFNPEVKDDIDCDIELVDLSVDPREPDNDGDF